LRTPAGLAAIGSAVLVLGGAIFLYQEFAEQKAAALRAQAAAEQHAATEAAARRQAELQAKADAEARRRAEEDAAQKSAAAEAARQQAADVIRTREAETSRLLNGRGSLVLVTEPAGASVEISNLAPHVTPVTLSDLRLGRYTIKLSLPGYDPANVEAEIKDNETTDPGTIRLVRQTGSLTLTTEPAGMSFEVRPAAARFFAAASDLRQGKTPATLADLPTGEYAVIFSREGWPNHTQNVVIEHNGSAQASSAFPGGSVTITSTPTGASVSRNGLGLGVTPLTIADVPPGAATYSLELNGFVPTDVTGQVEPDKAIHLEATLTPADRIARIADLDERPEPIKTVDPAINRLQEPGGGKVIISLTIDRDGTPKDLKIEDASNTQLGRRCLEAVEQWRFKPGKIRGVPVKTRVSLPFNIAAP
jgi:TonB family protein